MRDWSRYLGPAILVVAGILLSLVDVDLPIADTQVLGVVLIVAGLVWAAIQLWRQSQASRDAGGR
jgi:hypothetical protein